MSVETDAMNTSVIVVLGGVWRYLVKTSVIIMIVKFYMETNFYGKCYRRNFSHRSNPPPMVLVNRRENFGVGGLLYFFRMNPIASLFFVEFSRLNIDLVIDQLSLSLFYEFSIASLELVGGFSNSSNKSNRAPVSWPCRMVEIENKN